MGAHQHRERFSVIQVCFVLDDIRVVRVVVGLLQGLGGLCTLKVGNVLDNSIAGSTTRKAPKDCCHAQGFVLV